MHARNKFIKIFKIMCLIFLSTIFSIFFVEFVSFSLIKLGVKNLSLPSQESNTIPQKINSPFEHATSIEKLIITNEDPSQDNIDSSGFKNFFNNSIQVDGLSFPQKNTTITGLLKNNNKIIYSFHATIDNFGRRITSNIKNDKSFHKHLVMMGCSFVFGVGLDDQSTMPWLMQEKMPDYKLYNLSFVGYGPNSVLARALNYDFFSDIKPSEGIAAYIYISDHLNRFNGTAQRNSPVNWKSELAYLKEINPFEFEFKGSIKNNFPFQNNLNTWLTNSYTANLFSLSFPLVFESDVAQFVRQIKAIKMLYLKKTNQSNKFYFIFYPSSVGEDPYQSLIIKYLNQYEIDYLNYSKSTTLGMITDKPYLLPDAHPNRHANELFTDMLKNDLPK